MNQKRWIKITIIFFAIMLIFTIMSRGLHNLSLAKVDVYEVTDGEVSHDLNLTGTVSGDKNIFVLLPENLLVEDVFVSCGDEVEVGTSLFSVEKTTLDDEIKELQKTVGRDNQQKNNVLNRATQDYSDVVGSASVDVNNALGEYNKAVKNLNNYKAEHKPDETEDYYDEIETLKSEVSRTKTAYDEANANANKNIREANRSLEDARLDAGSTDTDESQKLLRQLLKVKSNNYTVLSDKVGIITKMDFNVGDTIAKGSFVLLSDKDSAGKVDITISEEEVKHITKKSKITLSGTAKDGEYVEYSDLKFTTKKVNSKSEGSNELNNDGYILSVSLENKNFAIGDDVQISVSNKSKDYDTCVPIEAIHQDENRNYFVYVVEEKETVLGTELVASKVNVKIADRNDEMVALKDTVIGYSDKVIIGTNKKVENGSKVKIRED